MPDIEVAEAPAEVEAPDTLGLGVEPPETPDLPDVPSEPEEEPEEEPEPVEAKQKEEEPETGGLPQQYAKDKFVKGLYHANQALKAAFPGGVKEAVELRTALESFGGTEALQTLEAERKEFQETDRLFSEGDPKAIEKFAKQSPAGFSKLMGPAIDKLGTVDPDNYNHVLAKVFWTTLRDQGVPNELNLLDGALKRQDIDAATQSVQRIQAFLQNINGFASNVPTRKLDPEREKLEAEKASVAKEKQETLVAYVDGKNSAYIYPKLEERLAAEYKAAGQPWAKLKATDPEHVQRLLSDANNEMQRLISATNQATLNRYYASLNAGRKDEAIRIAKTLVDASYAKAASITFKHYNRNIQIQAATKPEAAKPKPANGAVLLSKAPDKVNKALMYAKYGKDEADRMILKGQGYLHDKGEKLYDWSSAPGWS